MKIPLQTNIAVNDLYDTRHPHGCPTRSSVVQTIHCNVGLKCSFSI